MGLKYIRNKYWYQVSKSNLNRDYLHILPCYLALANVVVSETEFVNYNEMV